MHLPVRLFHLLVIREWWICMMGWKLKTPTIYISLIQARALFIRTLSLWVRVYRNQQSLHPDISGHMTYTRENSVGSFIPFRIPASLVMTAGKIRMLTDMLEVLMYGADLAWMKQEGWFLPAPDPQPLTFMEATEKEIIYIPIRC